MRTVLGFDVGGTNTRARAGAVDDQGHVVTHPRHPADRIEQLSSCAELEEFVRAVASDVGDAEAAVVAFAGPTIDDVATMTNWPGQPDIALEDALEWGLPVRTAVFNDLVAGAYGVLARIDLMGAESLVQLGGPSGEPTIGDGHLVYVAPGTGLGAATLVHCLEGRFAAVGCESQHTAATPPEGLNPLHQQIRTFYGRPPSWEDVISGAGLALLHALLDGRDPIMLREGPPDPASARAIARGAAEDDATAREAVEAFYDYLARFCQTLALSATPCEAVIVGGATTRENLPILTDNGFEQRFIDNPVHSALLSRTHLYAVAEDTNLEGCLRLAALLVE